MNQRFKQKYDELREGNPAKPSEEGGTTSKVDTENEFYDKPGNTRNIRFVWPDGRMKFYSYPYLVSCNFDPKDEINVISIEFTSDAVLLRGYKLRELFLALFNQLPCMISQVSPRYASATEGTFVVMEISIGPRESVKE